MSLHRRFRRDDGFSIIEVVVSLVIFSVAALGVASSVRTARRAEAESRAIAVASTLALDKIEYLRWQLGTSGELQVGAHQDPDNPLDSEGNTGGEFLRTWQITAADPTLGIRRLETTVSWSQRGGIAAVRFVTYLVQL